ncbi:MAG: type II toxin-antitoxin system ParD family antitoxin [Phyllobacteriaceae bacterium]|nr:type II toxin-antitoxin system ParD family antitoxin [Phyllobacteriaceae bacterium]
MSVKASVSISNQQDAFARSLVEEGRYASLSAVVQRGLDLLREETEAREADTKALKALLVERARGPFISMEESRRETEAMMARKRAERGI